MSVAGWQISGRPSLLRRFIEAWRFQRSRIIGNRDFQRMAARLPIARQIGARQARKLFDLTAGFVYSQVLFGMVEAGIFTYIAGGPKSTSEIADVARIPYERAEIMLRAAAELELLIADGDRWWLADLGAVVASNAGIQAMIRHHSMLYRDLADPLSLLRGGEINTEIKQFWSYAGTSGDAQVNDDQAAAYSQLMSLSQDLIIDEVLAAYRMGQHRQLLDIGGGEGRFLLAAAQRYPHLKLKLFDLPAVIDRLGDSQLCTSAGDRLELAPGDFFRDELPADCDLITLIRVLCDHDDRQALDLLRRIRAVMQPGHRLLIAEPLGGREGRAGGAAAYFAFYFLAMRSGRSRTPDDVRQLLTDAGFNRARLVRARQPLLTSLIVAEA